MDVSCSLRFAGLLPGVKLAGLSPAKCHAKMPCKKNEQQQFRQNPNSDSHTPPSAQVFFARHVMIEIPYSDVIKDVSHVLTEPYSHVIKHVSIITWPGKNPRSWEEYRSPSLDFCGAPGTILFARLSCVACCGAEPRKLYPRKKPRKTNRAGHNAVCVTVCDAVYFAVCVAP